MKKRNSNNVIFFYSYCLLMTLSFFVMFSRKSVEAWIFGYYSLPYFIFLIVFLTAIIYIGVLFYRFNWKAIYLISMNILFLASCFIITEITVQIRYIYNPMYTPTLVYQPDRVVGWKMRPDIHFQTNIGKWYWIESQPNIKLNSWGYHDIERIQKKRPNTIRVGLLGDSMVQAFQVPLSKTASQVLESKLNEAFPNDIQYEVLNFGVASYSVGQYLLMWEKYASLFNLDYIFIFTSEIQLNRTVNGYDGTTYKYGKLLNDRPTFSIKDSELIRKPVGDFDKIQELYQNKLEQIDETIMIRQQSNVFIIDMFNQVWDGLINYQRQFTGKSPGYDTVKKSTLAINLKVIEVLGDQVKKTNSQIIVVDASGYYFNPARPDKNLSKQLEIFCLEHEYGYVNLSHDLQKVNSNGIRTRWIYDGHFNEMGNNIFAESMYQWLQNKNYPVY